MKQEHIYGSHDEESIFNESNEGRNNVGFVGVDVTHCYVEDAFEKSHGEHEEKPSVKKAPFSQRQTQNIRTREKEIIQREIDLKHREEAERLRRIKDEKAYNAKLSEIYDREIAAQEKIEECERICEQKRRQCAEECAEMRESTQRECDKIKAENNAQCQKALEECKNETERKRKSCDKDLEDTRKKIKLERHALKLSENFAKSSQTMAKSRADAMKSLELVQESFIEIRNAVIDLASDTAMLSKKVDLAHNQEPLKALCKLYRELADSGMESSAQTLEDILTAGFGLSRFTPKIGEKYDPKHCSKQSGDNDGSVIRKVVYDGWRLDDTIIRKAVVTVC